MLLPSDLTRLQADWYMGKKLSRRGEYDHAVNIFTHILGAVTTAVLCPKTGEKPPVRLYCEALYERGFAHAKKDDDDLALADYDQAIDTATKRNTEKWTRKFALNAHVQRGIVRARAGDTNLAIEDFTSVIQLDKRHYGAHYRRGLAYQELLESELAKRDFAIAMALKRDEEPDSWNFDCRRSSPETTPGLHLSSRGERVHETLPNPLDYDLSRIAHETIHDWQMPGTWKPFKAPLDPNDQDGSNNAK